MMNEAFKIRAARVIHLLEEAYGREPWNWHTKQNPFQVLIGTVLSQRTRDENTDKAAKALFLMYDSPEMLAKASLKEIERAIRPSNYYRIKARWIKEISRILVEMHSGRTPESIEELLKLPGVGMKTASCALLYGHGISRIPVDVHVMIISQRLGWTDKESPDEIQEDLEGRIPNRYWNNVNELFVKHGQSICLTRSPKCGICPINRHCRHFQGKIH